MAPNVAINSGMPYQVISSPWISVPGKAGQVVRPLITGISPELMRSAKPTAVARAIAAGINSASAA